MIFLQPYRIMKLDNYVAEVNHEYEYRLTSDNPNCHIVYH